MPPANSPVQRIRSIDAFRGLTIFIMIFVNELAGVKGIPYWMEHMPANVDGMTFVDVVFPAFLFIVGMSIPFAIANRIAKGDNFFQVQKHILMRTLGMLVLGVFMVNAEEGYNQAAMPMSIFSWSLLFYGAAFLVWHVRLLKSAQADLALRFAGVLVLVYLGLIFRAGDGSFYLTPQWWGILGLIGWAYLLGSVCFQLTKGDVRRLLALLILCVVYYGLAHSHWAVAYPLIALICHCDLTAAHGSIVLCGVINSQLFFGTAANRHNDFQQRCLRAIAFASALASAAWVLRPEWPISKIAASPSWCLYSSAICVVIFMLLNYLVDVQQRQGWMRLFEPAAANPLLTYLLPFIVYAALEALHIPMADWMRQGATGMAWALGYALLILLLVRGLNRLNLRLQL